MKKEKKNNKIEFGTEAQCNCLVSIEIDVCALVASNLEPERLTVFYCGACLAQWQSTHNNRHSDNAMMTEPHELTVRNDEVARRRRRSSS